MRRSSLISVRSKSLLVLWLGLVGCILAGGSAQAQFSGPGNNSVPQSAAAFPLTTDSTVLFPPGQDIHLLPGDQVSVHVFGQNEYAPSVIVDTSGIAYLPSIGVVHLAGLTTQQADEVIARGLVDAGLYRDPQVTVTVTAGPLSVATLSGEMKSTVPILGSRPLLQVLSAGGGLPATASRVITIQRVGVDEPIIVDLGGDPTHTKGANIPILPGDTIFVSRIGLVYMIGAFKNPGTIALQNYAPLTLTEATALSGGYAFEGKYNDLRVIRTVGNHRTVVKVDVKRVLYGRDPDPILQANDIVFLPQSTLKGSISNGTFGTALGLFSIVYSIILTAAYH